MVLRGGTYRRKAGAFYPSQYSTYDESSQPQQTETYYYESIPPSPEQLAQEGAWAKVEKEMMGKSRGSFESEEEKYWFKEFMKDPRISAISERATLNAINQANLQRVKDVAIGKYSVKETPKTKVLISPESKQYLEGNVSKTVVKENIRNRIINNTKDYIKGFKEEWQNKSSPTEFSVTETKPQKLEAYRYIEYEPNVTTTIETEGNKIITTENKTQENIFMKGSEKIWDIPTEDVVKSAREGTPIIFETPMADSETGRTFFDSAKDIVDIFSSDKSKRQGAGSRVAVDTWIGIQKLGIGTAEFGLSLMKSGGMRTYKEGEKFSLWGWESVDLGKGSSYVRQIKEKPTTLSELGVYGAALGWSMTSLGGEYVALRKEGFSYGKSAAGTLSNIFSPVQIRDTLVTPPTKLKSTTIVRDNMFYRIGGGSERNFFNQEIAKTSFYQQGIFNTKTNRAFTGGFYIVEGGEKVSIYGGLIKVEPTNYLVTFSSGLQNTFNLYRGLNAKSGNFYASASSEKVGLNEFNKQIYDIKIKGKDTIFLEKLEKDYGFSTAVSREIIKVSNDLSGNSIELNYFSTGKASPTRYGYNSKLTQEGMDYVIGISGIDKTGGGKSNIIVGSGKKSSPNFYDSLNKRDIPQTFMQKSKLVEVSKETKSLVEKTLPTMETPQTKTVQKLGIITIPSLFFPSVSATQTQIIQVEQVQPTLTQGQLTNTFVDTIQIGGGDQVNIQRSSPSTMVTQITPSVSITPPSENPTVIPPFDFSFNYPRRPITTDMYPPLFDLFEEGTRKRKIKRKYKRNPTFASLLLGRTAAKPAGMEFTGLVERPIIKRGKR